VRPVDSLGLGLGLGVLSSVEVEVEVEIVESVFAPCSSSTPSLPIVYGGVYWLWGPTGDVSGDVSENG